MYVNITVGKFALILCNKFSSLCLCASLIFYNKVYEIQVFISSHSSQLKLHSALVVPLNFLILTYQGPYWYELFSIMIHSGSATGGHYYAYIK